MLRRTKKDAKSEPTDKLKEANKKLRAKVRQLQKQLKQALERLEADDYEEEEVETVEEVDLSPPSLICESCKERDVEVIPLGMHIVHKCNSCGNRKRINA